MPAKRSRRERPPSLSSEKEAFPENRIDKCSILIGHLDKLNHYDVFLLDSIFVGRKLDFPYIMLNHKDSVICGTRPKALPYRMILIKIFHHFKVFFCDAIVLLPRSTDTINTLTFKRMKIFKDDGQWIAKSKVFDDELGPSTLPFEGGEEMDEDEDALPT
ncbi:Uncharacterized protein Adt_20274 [Abeliophyllum distichum]|uniref:Uncharacterized protein n=1 Tax=Abeliophyllum distichum TaxID=126358 RepID=A0ABD1SW42_9LAMI